MSGLRRFLYYPERLSVRTPPPAHAAGAAEAWIGTADGETIHGLYWPAPAGRPTVLFFHGNAGHVFDWALVREDLAGLEAGLLLVDYRGYGKSTGRPSESGLAEDAEGSLRWLGERGVPEERVVLFGKSLGGGVAVELARRHAVCGLVLESTFTSIPAVAEHLFPVFPVGDLFPDRFESAAKLPEVHCPLLVVHGSDDALIPLSEGQALFQAAPEPKTLWVVPGADHNDVSWVAREAYGQRLREWLDGVWRP
jgi:fermentation-respiration switch protein FrsA (DUF1100 family)